jgi:hypothetical protein
MRAGVGSGAIPYAGRRGMVDDDDANGDEPRPRGALLLIMIYLVVLAAFWLNTYLRIWRS